jgi:segregation and condensation protein A
LLPVEQQVVVEGEEEGEDPRWELIRQLVEYKKFKDAAAQLQKLEVRQEDVYPRLPGKVEFAAEAKPVKLEVSIFDLLNAVNAVLKRIAAKEAGTREIFEDKWSVSEKIELVLKVLSERSQVRFSELFEDAASRWEVICTFLALLELIRLKQLACTQPEPFSEIEICRSTEKELAETAPASSDEEFKLVSDQRAENETTPAPAAPGDDAASAPATDAAIEPAPE